MSDTSDPSLRDSAQNADLRTTGAIETPPPDAETLRRLEAAIASMPRMQREIFLAVRLDAMTYWQIADATGLSVAQVERKMARAMRHFMRKMSDDPAPRPWWRRWLRLP